ncbi:bifunctional methionine sulfoxide reductase B/A protein [Flammeovirga kamogawensis]|uniref:Peptide methionine sulfoxide reductase MsrA n=1 Tax=Flammeovirga kamogawensis TaxID=373891 RepID=A0ABX8GYD6_9BACT|nr:bifunctional methionine sulfoxide reductase B/A protein [Flammeovirga kamogawensis]MBB6460871.1 peptide methionine sulfoxide reductase msrA/msrB [Flammeovirga kamogawensis]QWG08217.1 bifunctional methionine sulfoxide reductase B/A protein [Flammeovirga kamogawensis]TRX70020.1 bifunctional methionine sulfoxide reductase B/A protein [Flammeovirga kamogawensis]
MKKLTPFEEWVIINKGTERPFTGKYNRHDEPGTYVCKKCSSPLYKSEDKFESGCGWPSFDDEVDGAIKRVTDLDGQRTEILCSSCDAHLGHVFENENLTQKNVRHCVNSISLDFKGIKAVSPKVAIFASGCFWGTQYYFLRTKGVMSSTVGYIGGTKDNPTYEEICSGETGHAEAVKIVYDSDRIGYDYLAKLFFETHDPTQINKQGPDIGTQYRSEIFYFDDDQKEKAQILIAQLKAQGLAVATTLTDASELTFWEAEDYHQDYYEKTAGKPYCHIYTKRF